MQKACMILRPSPSRSSSTNPPQPVLSALFERGGGAGAGANQRDGAGGEGGGKVGGGVSGGQKNMGLILPRRIGNCTL